MRKRFVSERDGYDIYTVDAGAIRNGTPADEEFDNFATHDEFPDLIPEREIWIAERSLAADGRYFLAGALARLQALERGASEERAIEVGLKAERDLRRRKSRIRYRAGRPHARVPARIRLRRYVSLPDDRGPIEVWLVDGTRVRNTYRTEFTQGGHGYVYFWCPKDEIWIERDLGPEEMPRIVAHEYVELRLMRDEGLDYEEAHRAATLVESDLGHAVTRKGFPGFGRAQLSRENVPALTRAAFLDHVEKHYVRRRLRRAGA